MGECPRAYRATSICRPRCDAWHGSTHFADRAQYLARAGSGRRRVRAAGIRLGPGRDALPMEGTEMGESRGWRRAAAVLPAELAIYTDVPAVGSVAELLDGVDRGSRRDRHPEGDLTGILE